MGSSSSTRHIEFQDIARHDPSGFDNYLLQEQCAWSHRCEVDNVRKIPTKLSKRKENLRQGIAWGFLTIFGDHPRSPR